MNTRFALVAHLAALSFVLAWPAPGARAGNMLSPYTPYELAPRLRPDVGPIDMAMRPDGETIIPSGPVSNGDIVATMPFAYARTAVLMSDIKGRSIWNRGFHEAAVGAPGYYVGRYRTSTPVAAGEWEQWCFFPSRVGGAHESLCLFMGADHQLDPVGIIPNENPFWPDRAAKFPQGNGAGNGVVLHEEPIAIAPGLTLKYRFLGWTPSGAEVAFLVADHPAGSYHVKFEPDGSAHLGLLAGSYVKLMRDSSDPARAISTFVPTGASFDR